MALAVYLNKSIFPVSVNTGDFSGKLPTTLSVRAGDGFVGDTADPLVISALAASLIVLIASDPGNYLAGIVPGTSDAAALGPVLAKLTAGPTTITLVSGNGQSAVAGVALGAALVVKVTDSNGLPVAGIPVQWLVTAGGGSLLAASSLTNASGLAPGVLTTGGTPGTNTVKASAFGAAGALSGSPVTFTATGT